MTSVGMQRLQFSFSSLILKKSDLSIPILAKTDSFYILSEKALNMATM